MPYERQIRSYYDRGAVTPGSADGSDVAAANSHQPVADATTRRRLPR